ncbi:golgin subfamily A member 6-like protein 22 [Artemia franciscana]|uniref:golgin subfamily A member 6-like protein 22 n=1 Tax=Artemia franciscana TaxID=6661 RepID=UPI0032DB4180
MDPNLESREHELELFFTENFPTMNRHELLKRPTVDLVIEFLFNFLKLIPTKSDEKFEEYLKAVTARYMQLVGGDPTYGKAHALYHLCKPFLAFENVTDYQITIWDILQPTPNRVKAMVLECLNYYGFVNFIQGSEDQSLFIETLNSWEERNIKKSEHEVLLQHLINEIDREKMNREKDRITKEAMERQHENLQREVKALTLEQKSLEDEKSSIKATILKHQQESDEYDEEIRKALMVIENLKGEIVESPEKAQEEMRSLREQVDNIKEEVAKAQSILTEKKRTSALREEAAYLSKKDSEILQNIIETTEQVEKTIRDHQIAHDQLNAGKEILAQAEARKIKAQQDVKQREEKLVVTEAKMWVKSQSAAEEIEEIEL